MGRRWQDKFRELCRDISAQIRRPSPPPPKERHRPLPSGWVEQRDSGPVPSLPPGWHEQTLPPKREVA